MCHGTTNFRTGPWLPVRKLSQSLPEGYPTQSSSIDRSPGPRSALNGARGLGLNGEGAASGGLEMGLVLVAGEVAKVGVDKDQRTCHRFQRPWSKSIGQHR